MDPDSWEMELKKFNNNLFVFKVISPSARSCILLSHPYPLSREIGSRKSTYISSGTGDTIL